MRRILIQIMILDAKAVFSELELMREIYDAE
ncbi:unnamed protein product [Larinioides sclopetarius]|uniref:Uncharacterized protein n=1 Tax=Larinioides sclopetarius TaxID=280406 RepID=A0AAV1YS58_9ARAC